MGLAKVFKLIGVLLADGSIDYKRYTISFTENKELVEDLCNEFRDINGIKLKWIIEPQINSYRARAYSKELRDFLLKFSPTFRTRPYNVHPISNSTIILSPTIPKECFSSKKFAKEFLIGFISCDGGPELSVYRRRDKNCLQLHTGVKIGCKNEIIRKQLAELLKQFDINPIKRSDGLQIKNTVNLKNFKNDIGFAKTAKVKKSKIFNDFYKNDILFLIVLCNNLSKKGYWINTNFKDEDELEKFLLQCCKMIESKKFAKLYDFIFQKTGYSLGFG